MTSENPKRTLRELGKGALVDAREIVKADVDSGTKRVLKEYRKESVTELFGNKVKPEEVVSILKRNRAFTKEYYKELPGLVLNTKVFMGKGKDDEPTIYEVQPNVEGHTLTTLGLRSIYDSVAFEREYVWKFSIDQRKNLVKELSYFIDRTNDFIHGDNHPEEYKDFLGKVIDLNEGNVVITSDGHLKVLDTNVYKNLWDEDTTLDQIEGSIADLKYILRNLERSLLSKEELIKGLEKLEMPKSVVVTSVSAVKVEAVKKVLGELFPGKDFNVTGMKVDSGINEQPVEGETERGARHRIYEAERVLGESSEPRVFISVENGIFKTAGEDYEDRAVALVEIASGGTFPGVSTLKVDVPLEIVRATQEKEGGFKNHTVGEAFVDMFAKRGITIDKQNPHIAITNGEFSREDQIINAIEEAFKAVISRRRN